MKSINKSLIVLVLIFISPHSFCNTPFGSNSYIELFDENKKKLKVVFIEEKINLTNCNDNAQTYYQVYRQNISRINHLLVNFFIHPCNLNSKSTIELIVETPLNSKHSKLWIDQKKTCEPTFFSKCYTETTKLDIGFTSRSNIYPINTYSDSTASYTVAINPNEPRNSYGIMTDAHFKLKLPLGFLPYKNSPAKYSLIFYKNNANSSFRDSLNHYYSIFKQYYLNNSIKSGAWLSGVSDEDFEENISERSINNYIKFYLHYKKLPKTPRNQNGISFPYTIGMVKVRNLIDKNLLNPVRNSPFYLSKELGTIPRYWLNRYSDISNSLIINDRQRIQIDKNHSVDKKGNNLLSLPVNLTPYCDFDKNASKVLYEFYRTVRNNSNLNTGIYFDYISSLTKFLDHNELYMRCSKHPLIFKKSTNTIALHNKFAIYDFLKEARELFPEMPIMLNGMKKFKGGVQYIATQGDIIAIEGLFSSSLKQRLKHLYYARIISGQKPVVHTLNSYNVIENSKDLITVENWHRSSTFLGITAVVRNSLIEEKYIKQYHKIFTKYSKLSIILQDSGWQPITYAHSNKEDVLVERFGLTNEKLSILNTKNKRVTFTISLDKEHFNSSTIKKIHSLMTNKNITNSYNNKYLTIDLTLPPLGLEIIEIL